MPLLPQALKFSIFATKEDAATALAGLVDRLSNADLDEKSAYKAKFAATRPLKVSNWASGGCVGALRTADNVWTFKDKGVADFFVALFEEVRAGAKARFARADLFHGHINFYKGTLLIVFHAAEYPIDLPDTEAPAKNAALVEPGVTIRVTDANFRYRNAIYWFSTGILETLDTQKLDAKWKDHFDPKRITLLDGTLGSSVAGLNLFSTEGIPFPFLA